MANENGEMEKDFFFVYAIRRRSYRLLLFIIFSFYWNTIIDSVKNSFDVYQPVVELFIHV